MKIQLTDLVIKNSPAKAEVIYKPQDENKTKITIGRASTNDIVIPNPKYRNCGYPKISERASYVSRETHCLIFESKGGIGVKNFSKTKTYINNKEIPDGTAALLRDGDILKLCSYELQVKIGGDEAEDLKVVD